MLQEKSIFWKEIKNNHYLFVNLVFAFFPFSFIFGSLVVNLNLLLFCCLGIFYLRSKILRTKYDLIIKIIFLFFLIVFLSTTLNVVKSYYFDGHRSDVYLVQFSKSILFFRYFLFLIIAYLLNKYDILDFKYFFLVAAFAATLVSIDLIYQYIFGFNLIGLENPFPSTGTADEGKPLSFWTERLKLYPRNSGFFGDEYIAGGYIQRFAFFAIFAVTFLFKNKSYTKFIFLMAIICILGVGILFAGNRMPLILFIFGLFLVFLFNLKIKKILFISLISLLIILTFIISSNKSYKHQYHNLSVHIKSMLYLPATIIWPQLKKIDEQPSKIKKIFYQVRKIRLETNHERLFLTAIDTWKFSKIYGNGIKSFREVCHKLGEKKDINMEERVFTNIRPVAPEEVFYFGKKNRLCSNHPHNYYLEILTETGAIGLIIISVIALMFIIFLFKNYKLINKISLENFILLSAIISLVLEATPIRSSGSIFTTNNATYLVIIASIVLSYKKILKIKTE